MKLLKRQRQENLGKSKAGLSNGVTGGSSILKPMVTSAFLLLLLSSLGCFNEKPVPPEVSLVQVQEADLWRAEAPLYLPDQYADYKEHLTLAQKNLLKTNAQFRWFRDYKAVQAEFLQLLNQGEELSKKLRVEKEEKAKSIFDQMESLKERLRIFTQLTLMLHEGGPSRSSLTKAGVALNEAVILLKENRLLASEQKLAEVEMAIMETEEAMLFVLGRYQNSHLISKWKEWAQETIEKSKERDIYSILIIKSEKKLILFKKGKAVNAYPIGLGKKGWLKKRYAKDHATPEGKYRIIGKNPRSRFYKALLINYPNEHDRREFQDAQEKGRLLKKAGIGGLIEIHGGGKGNLTEGCIALDNGPMEEIYNVVGTGTPVTIVGALDEQNSISSALQEMQRTHGQKKTP
jgi:L,D-peptidoglycan transpeptidase YkuD (ErfK/YbiS/YcfS/YnhG family)